MCPKDSSSSINASLEVFGGTLKTITVHDSKAVVTWRTDAPSPNSALQPKASRDIVGLSLSESGSFVF